MHRSVCVSPSAFDEDQRLRKREIVSRILKEEAAQDGRKRRLLPLAKTAARPAVRDRTWGYIAEVCEGKAATAAPCNPVVSPPRSTGASGTGVPGVVRTGLPVDA